MRLAYGIHGYGRGHAMRARAVLPGLTEKADLLVFAGGDAYEALSGDFCSVRIPTLDYKPGRAGGISTALTLAHNLPMVIDSRLHGPTFGLIADQLLRFGPNVIVTDSEIYTHRTAEALGIPRISFDHFGAVAHGRLPLSGLDRLKAAAQSRAYFFLFGRPDRAIVTAFFDVDVGPGVVRVGPVIRREVLKAVPSAGEHILVYCNKQAEFTQALQLALARIGLPCRIYGAPFNGKVDKIEFKPFSNTAFIEDMASARAVIATTGNQLCGEVIHFRKPIIGLPQPCLEQRINADQIVRMGAGIRLNGSSITAGQIKNFLSREKEFRANSARVSTTGAEQSVEMIMRFASELAKQPAAATEARAALNLQPPMDQSPMISQRPTLNFQCSCEVSPRKLFSGKQHPARQGCKVRESACTTSCAREPWKEAAITTEG